MSDDYKFASYNSTSYLSSQILKKDYRNKISDQKNYELLEFANGRIRATPDLIKNIIILTEKVLDIDNSVLNTRNEKGFTYVTRYTPIGSIVPNTIKIDDQYSNSYRSSTDIYYSNHYPTSTLLYYPGESYSTTIKFNCHGYAWHMRDGNMGDQVWIGYQTADAEDIYWEDGSYTETSYSASSNIVVRFSENHSARATSTNNYFISKCGGDVLMKHHKDDCPSIYGSAYKYYKLTPPLSSVTISGPTRLIGHQFDRAPQYHATGTWTANTVGGSNKTYKWYKRNSSQPERGDDTRGSWYLLSGETSRTLTETLYYNYWGIDLKCVVISNGIQKEDQIHVYVTGDEPIRDSSTPESVVLGDNSPNPFNPATQIKFGLPQHQKVEVDVYSITGKKIKTLVNNTMDAGYHTIEWNATNDNGVKVSSGVYIYQLRCGNEVFTKKMIFTK